MRKRSRNSGSNVRCSQIGVRRRSGSCLVQEQATNGLTGCHRKGGVNPDHQVKQQGQSISTRTQEGMVNEGELCERTGEP